MDFNKEIDSILAGFTDTTKFFKELAEGAPKKYRDRIQKRLEDSSRKRVEYAEALIEMKIRHKAMCAYLEQDKQNPPSYEEWKSGWENHQEAVMNKRTNVKNLNEFKNIKQAIEAAAKLNNPQTSSGNNRDLPRSEDDEDDDIQIQGNSNDVFSIFDPWTKEVMLHPVRNTKCGHVYDRDSVMRIIKESLSTRCPVLGCGSKHYLHPNMLVEDEEIRQRVLRQLKEDDDGDQENEVDDFNNTEMSEEEE
ncbi:hypothetical protein KR074_000781 [Drosophila pseudoananassae]|nr:hypothetical protein KR074_000781 [Drosophila pseudoananassae]